MSTLTRRTALTAIAIAPAALPLTAAAEGSDAKLIALWAEYVRLEGEEDKALEVFNRAEEAASDDGPAHDWRYHGINFRGPKQPLAVFVCNCTIETKTFVLKAKTVRKQEAEAHTIAERLRKEAQQDSERARKKHRVEDLNRAVSRITNKMDGILREIGETPATTMKGMAVKVAALNEELDFMQEPASEVVASTYRDIVPLLEVRSPRADWKA